MKAIFLEKKLILRNICIKYSMGSLDISYILGWYRKIGLLPISYTISFRSIFIIRNKISFFFHINLKERIFNCSF